MAYSFDKIEIQEIKPVRQYISAPYVSCEVFFSPVFLNAGLKC